MKKLIIFLLFGFLTSSVFSQKQLLVMKGERVLLRLYPGDEIVFKLKGSNRKWTTYVNNLFDGAVVTHRDTIPFNKIDRIYFKQEGLHNRLGRTLVIGGIALFAIDQLNYSVIQGNEANIDSWVSRASLTAIGVGLPLWLAKKKSQRIDGRYRLVTVKEGSPFWKPDRRQNMADY